MLGPRIGRFGAGGVNLPMPGHSVPFISLGAFILIFGFFAFNGGSRARITGEEDGVVVAKAVVNTLLGCIGGGLAVLFTTKIFRGGKWSLVQLINGCLAGAANPQTDPALTLPAQAWSPSVLAVTASSPGPAFS